MKPNTHLICSPILYFIIIILSFAPAEQGYADQRKSERLKPLTYWHSLRHTVQGPLSPGKLASVKAKFYKQYPEFLKHRPEKFSVHADAVKDPTYSGRHPMFQRLQNEGWFSPANQGRIQNLQNLADQLSKNRPNPRTSLSKVEFLAFDFEATNLGTGHFDHRTRRFYSGWDQITQIGYAVFRGGQVVEKGSININPDVAIDPFVQQKIGLTKEMLTGSPRFEHAAEKLLKLMQGRVLIGQSAMQSDWSWMRSNLARMGVDLPNPNGLILDTYYLSFNFFPKRGAGLKTLSQHFNVNLGHHHDASCDALATGNVCMKMFQSPRRPLQTLSEAFALQARGKLLMHCKKLPQAMDNLL